MLPTLLETDSNIYTPINPQDKDPMVRLRNASRDKDAGIQVTVGAYMAVVIAAFGGVRVKTASNTTAEMHPFVVLILVVPLFVVQMTTIFALRLDLDVSKGVLDASTLRSDTKTASIIALKCLMVFLVQLTSFGVLLSTLRMAAFVINPVTWFEVAHPESAEWLGETEYPEPDNPSVRTVKKDPTLECKLRYFKWFFHPSMLAIPCLISLACRFGVCYLVCVDSMSIIFAASTMTEAVFNALVLTFINELNEIYWQFLGVILNVKKLDDIQFKVRDQARIAINKITNEQEMDPGDDIFASQRLGVSGGSRSGDGTTSQWFIHRVIQAAPFLCREKGFHKIENAIAFFWLFFIYVQQLFVVIFALATNVLPVARDICTMWRWSHGDAQFFKKLAPRLVQFVDMVTLVHIDLDVETSHMPIGSCRPARDDDKTGMFGIYYRMVNSDKIHMVKGAPHTFVKSLLNDNGKGYKIVPSQVDDAWTAQAFWFGFACILAIVTLPQLSSFRALFRKVLTKMRCGAPAIEEEAERTKIACSPTDEEAQQTESGVKMEADSEIAKLKATIEEMQRNIQKLHDKIA